jgi:hypothetical protein
VAGEVDLVLSRGAEFGLNLNVAKCELVCDSDTAVSSPVFQSFMEVRPENAVLLGAPLFSVARLWTTL